VNPASRLRRAIWLILPVVLGGLGHVAVLKTDVLSALAIPLDGGTQWRGRPLFGANKTWRGIIVMTTATAFAAGLQGELARRLHGASEVEARRSARVNAWSAGAICGLTYCIAELPNSFVKRRLGIAPGARTITRGGLQYLVDQGDSVVGCLIALRLLYRANAGELVTAFVLGLAIHIAVDAVRA
jgi:CDP-archaeol synthase